MSIRVRPACIAFVSPAIIAFRMRRPLMPMMSEITDVELDVGVLQRLLNTLNVLRELACQLRSRPRQIAHSWIGAGGTKLARIKPCARRSEIHTASLTSLLRPGTLRMCAAFASTSSNLTLQDVPDRLPVDAGGLHRHVRDPLRLPANPPAPTDRALPLKSGAPRGLPFVLTVNRAHATTVSL